MPWNEPGNNGNNKQQDPWGGKRNQNPPDLDKIIGDFIKKVRGFFKQGFKNKPGEWPPEPQSGSNNGKEFGVIVGTVLVVILAAWFLSGFFIVNPAEQAVLLRLGKYNDTLDPGLHWYARFIDSKYSIDVQKIYSFSLEGDFLTKSAEQGDLPTQVVGTANTGVSLDQSKNLVNVELNVQYRISDPRAYLFSTVNPDDTIQQVATGALSDVIGQMKLDDVLTTGREMVSRGVLDRTKLVLAGYNSGLEVVAVTLKRVQAPDEVRAAFSDVNRADQDRATTIQQAQAYASKVVPIAQGDAARILADANAYQQQVVLNAEANVARYTVMLKAFQSSPEVTRERLYLDMMQNLLKNTNKVLVDGSSNNNLVYLPLDKLMSSRMTQTPIAENTSDAATPAPTQNSGDKNDTH